MEELLELKTLLFKGDIKGSLAIVEELEEMSKLEVEEGRYDTEELEKLVNKQEIVNNALAKIAL